MTGYACTDGCDHRGGVCTRGNYVCDDVDAFGDHVIGDAERLVMLVMVVGCARKQGCMAVLVL